MVLRREYDTRALLSRPATTAKGLWRWFPGRRQSEELDDAGTEGIRKLLEDGDSRVFQSALQTAYVSSIDASVAGESLLRQAARYPEPPEISGHKRLRSHTEEASILSTIKPRTIVL